MGEGVARGMDIFLGGGGGITRFLFCFLISVFICLKMESHMNISVLCTL